MADINPIARETEVERVRLKLDHLTSVLGGFAPVTGVQPSLVGTPPNFVGINYCWSFEDGSPALYHRVAQVINDFRGTMRWNFSFQFNQKGACISAWAKSNEFYSAIPDSKSSHSHAEDIAESQPSLADEINKLCGFMESELGVKNPRPMPSAIPTSTISQFERSVYDVTLVRDVKRFRWPNPTSDVDMQLGFGLTYDEWHGLFFQVLGKSGGEHPINFQGQIDAYPILSRLNDIHDNAAVEESEVITLEGECLKLEAISRENTAARECLRKLLLICRSAEDLKTGIYFLGD